MASRKKHRPSGQHIDLSVTFVPATDEEVRAMIRAVAELAVAHLRAREVPPKPAAPTFPCDGDRGNVA